MAVTLNSTNITFNDGTVQTTAAGSAPTFNTVGSYANVYTNGGSSYNPGSNYAVGFSANQIRAYNSASAIAISGTWKWMTSWQTDTGELCLVCRVS